MDKRKKAKGTGYRDRLATAMNVMDFPAGGVGRVTVHHDEGCAIWGGSECNCVPDISIYHDRDDISVVDQRGSVSRVKRS